MFHKIGEIVKEAGVALGVDVLWGKLKKEGAPIVAEQVKKKLTDEYRAELLAFIRKIASYDATASETLLRRQRDRQREVEKSYPPNEKYLAGSEDQLVTLLSKLYIALGDSPEEEEARIEVFVWLGRMNDEDFDSTIEFLYHDIVMQYIRKAVRVIGLAKPELQKLYKLLKESEDIKAFDNFVGGKLKNMNNSLQKKWWVR